jgi:uncharacterized protein YggT (Ycf19 family)
VYEPRRPDVRREEYRSVERPADPVDRYDRVGYGPPPPGYNYRAVQITWFVIGLIDVLLAFRFFLKLTGASPQAEFVGFIYGITGPLVAPFRGIFADSGQGFYIFEPSTLVAIAVYLLLGWGIVTLIKIMTTPRGTRAVD